MAVFSKLSEVATPRNTASVAVAAAIVWTLFRKASANQKRRYKCMFLLCCLWLLPDSRYVTSFCYDPFNDPAYIEVEQASSGRWHEN